jgi:hypothetical protein
MAHQPRWEGQSPFPQSFLKAFRWLDGKLNYNNYVKICDWHFKTIKVLERIGNSANFCELRIPAINV